MTWGYDSQKMALLSSKFTIFSQLKKNLRIRNLENPFKLPFLLQKSCNDMKYKKSQEHVHRAAHLNKLNETAD